MFRAIDATGEYSSIAYVYVDEATDMEYTTIYVINIDKL